MQEARNILQKHWGHAAFRELQEDIIRKAVNNEDVLALLPTGGGKSLCFQIPALLKPGICLVVSPLIALMEDQVNSLKQKGIKALAITGGISFPDLDTLLDNCIYGNYKFLYLSPERLQQDIVQERIKQMNVNLIAVDEAHCISQWGHDFRPAYRNIALLRELKPEVNMMGLTASATELVVKDIVDQLQLKGNPILKKSFERKNIAYSVKEAQDKNYYLVKLLSEHKEAVIIYVRTRKATLEIAGFLEKKGFSAAAFHGGIAKKEKSLRLKQWLEDKKRIMVATTAFGMGIDKANVRTVVHMNLPESLESYFQEAGRAGRDEKPSKAVILTNESDVPLLKNQFLSTLPEVAFVKKVYRKLTSYFRIAFGEGEGSQHDFNFSHFCHTYNLNTRKAYNTLQLLDRLSVIQLSEQFKKKTRIQFLISHKQLSYFLETKPYMEGIVKAVLRTYGGAFENKVEIDLQTISSKAGTTPAEVVQILNQLNKEGVVEFEHDQHDASVSFLVPREDDSTINPLAPYIRLQEKTKKEKIEAVLTYIGNAGKCRSQQLLDYFGEKKTRPCGICSVCQSSAARLNKEKMKEIYYAIIGLLEESSCTSREMAERLPFPEEHIVSVLRMLVERGALTKNTSNHYKLKHL